MRGLRAASGRAGWHFLGLWLLAGCELQQGFSGLNAEWERARTGPYHVVSVAEDRAVISAKGRQVAIEPAEGFCLAQDALETSLRSAFALIGDCALDASPAEAPLGAHGELQLPRGVPGIITVSVSGQADIGSEEGQTELVRFLESPDGQMMLGRGVGSSGVEVVESRRIGSGVYVLVDDANADLVPVLDPRFWRGFIEVNDRLAVVTVSGFRASPLGTEQMLKYLVNQIQTLARANREPIYETQQTLIAERSGQDEERGETGALALTELEPEPLVAAVIGIPSETSVLDDPALWPVPSSRPDGRKVDRSGELPGLASSIPTRRPGGTAVADVMQSTAAAKILHNSATTEVSVTGSAEAIRETDATRFAPERAPRAPRRPGNA